MVGPPASDTSSARAVKTSTSTSPTPTPTPQVASRSNIASSASSSKRAYIASAASPVSTPASSAASPSSNAPSPSANPSGAAHAQPPHLSIRPVVARTLSAASPVSAGSPVNKMAMSSVISPMPQSPGANAKMPISMTSKEWVIPPRPKPGRKPATDTPPTKRKAQNRAAQRAFRERRAARVGELEEQLDAEKDEHEKNERELRDRVHTLEMEAQSLQTRCQMLENMLERQKADHAKELEAARNASRHGSLPPIQHHADNHHRSSYYSHHSSRGSTSSPRHTPSRRSSAQPFSISQIISPPDEVEIEAPPISCGSCTSNGACACVDEVLATESVGCGKCTLGSRCECLEESINSTVSALPTASGSDLKRPLPPGSPNSVAPNEKRLRSDSSIETDFTGLFSHRRRDSSASQMSVASSHYAPVPIQAISVTQQQLAPILRSTEDKCGFCKDGTYCVCADESLTLPAILPISQQTHTPPPSETDAVPMEIQADGAVKLRRTNNATKKVNAPAATRSGCGSGGPGTCAQCLADPKSGLFCRALSANFQRQTGRDSGCCGGGGAGGCCKSKPTASTLAKAQVQSSLGLSLSCADAYKTLASHRHFDEAADDIGAWLPLLKAAPKGTTIEPEVRTPIEVEAASIMSVLKGFDVRFGG